MSATAPHKTPILPPLLQPGDTIGLFCPAGPVRAPEAAQAGIAWLQEQGYRIQTCRDVCQDAGNGAYLAGPDRDRVEELHGLWQDPEIKALWAVRGGFGCLRILDRLDYDLFRHNPKLLIGFSDVTALLAALFTRAGLIGLHGPVVTSIAKTKKPFLDRLSLILEEIPEGQAAECTMLRPGRATGHLVVANLTTLVHLVATPWQPDLNQAILVIEDTGESLYRVDRMLTHLFHTRQLDHLAGIILGRFDHGPDQGFTHEEQEQLGKRVLVLTQKNSCPVWSGFPLGHGHDNLALPFGMTATMTDGGTLLLHAPGKELQVP